MLAFPKKIRGLHLFFFCFEFYKDIYLQNQQNGIFLAGKYSSFCQNMFQSNNREVVEGIGEAVAQKWQFDEFFRHRVIMLGVIFPA